MSFNTSMKKQINKTCIYGLTHIWIEIETRSMKTKRHCNTSNKGVVE